MSAKGLLDGYVICRTDYSGSTSNRGYRPSYGFWFQGTNITISAGDGKQDLRVRCVKDIK